MNLGESLSAVGYGLAPLLACMGCVFGDFITCNERGCSLKDGILNK